MKHLKFLSKLLVLTICAGLLPVQAFALASDSQLDTGASNNVRLRGEWNLPVPGNSVVALGLGDLAFRFSFSSPITGEQKESALYTNAFPVTPEMASFGDDWLKTAQYLERGARDRFGDQLQFISFDRVRAPAGDPVYVMFLTLTAEGQTVEATVCYRFLKSYYAVHVGLNTGDMPEMYQLTRKAAGMFVDETPAPYTIDPEIVLGAEIMEDTRPWELPVLNIFPILLEFSEWEFAPAEQSSEEPAGNEPEDDTELLIAPWQERQELLLKEPEVIADNQIASPFQQDGKIYLIETAEQLALLGRLIYEQATFEEGIRAQFASYRLENDLALTQMPAWTPIGDFIPHNALGGDGKERQYLAFSGNFDGNGKAITGLTARPRSVGEEYVTDSGFFGYTINAHISGLTLLNCDIQHKNELTISGAVVAWGDGATTIEDCHVYGTVKGGYCTGGIAGIAKLVERCSFMGSVESMILIPSLTGGIVGNAWKVKDCQATAIVKGQPSVGRIAGLADSISGCDFCGKVEEYEDVG